MLEQIRWLIKAQPFTPFFIDLSSGRRLQVPTDDHVAFAPLGNHLIIFDDEYIAAYVSALHVVGVNMQASTVAA